LGVISLRPGLSNAELSRATELAPQTVSAVLEELEEQHLVTRGEVLRGRRGQPATPLFMNPVGALAIGAEIGWRHLEVTLVGIGTQVLGRIRRDYDYPDAGSVFDELAAAVEQLLQPLPAAERERLVGLGLAVPNGFGQPGSLLPPPAGQDALWRDLDIADAVADATGLDVTMFNDGHAACWAERVAHPNPRPANFVFLLIDTFMGGGVLAENRLWEGATGKAAHLGATLIPDGDGRLHFADEIASLFALERRLAERGLRLDDALVHAKAAAEPVVQSWIGEAAEALAQTLVNACTVTEFEVAIIESALPPEILRRLVEATRQQMGKFPVLGQSLPLPIIAGHLGRSGAAEGAALLLMYRRYFSRDFEHMDL
jgi:predicted NBD/HSP70 family sugar kinase